MKMASSTIVIFGPLFSDEISFPTSIVVLENYNALGMSLWILLHQIDLGSCHMVAASRIVLAIIKFCKFKPNIYEKILINMCLMVLEC
jgi:hypothetical protein